MTREFFLVIDKYGKLVITSSEEVNAQRLVDDGLGVEVVKATYGRFTKDCRSRYYFKEWDGDREWECHPLRNHPV